jgi:hypothetical protein
VTFQFHARVKRTRRQDVTGRRILPTSTPYAGGNDWLVFFATVIDYLDRQTLSVVAPVLRLEFHMTHTTYSRVVFAFMLAKRL